LTAPEVQLPLATIGSDRRQAVLVAVVDTADRTMALI
jgi:hypothetical protein